MYKCKVEICGVDTSKLPVLKESQKEELLRAIKNGNETAREELINGNLRLVLSVIQRFLNRGENVDDLFQVGCIGLIKAIDNCFPQHGSNNLILKDLGLSQADIARAVLGEQL